MEERQPVSNHFRLKPLSKGYAIGRAHRENSLDRAGTECPTYSDLASTYRRHNAGRKINTKPMSTPRWSPWLTDDDRIRGVKEGDRRLENLRLMAMDEERVPAVLVRHLREGDQPKKGMISSTPGTSFWLAAPLRHATAPPRSDRGGA